MNWSFVFRYYEDAIGVFPETLGTRLSSSISIRFSMVTAELSER